MNKTIFKPQKPFHLQKKKPKPVVEEAPVDQIVKEGESAEFRCRIVPPPAHAVWLFRDDVIDSSDIYRVSRDGAVHVLTLPECFPEDSGRYTLRTVDEEGEVVEAGAELIVEGLTSFPDAPSHPLIIPHPFLELLYIPFLA